jgi:hypothetical protein
VNVKDYIPLLQVYRFNPSRKWVGHCEHSEAFGLRTPTTTKGNPDLCGVECITFRKSEIVTLDCHVKPIAVAGCVGRKRGVNP